MPTTAALALALSISAHRPDIPSTRRLIDRALNGETIESLLLNPDPDDAVAVDHLAGSP